MAMYENIESLDKEIERLTKTLASLDPTGEQYKTVRINLDTLYKLRNEQYKVDTEDLEKRDKLEAESKQKAEELEIRKQELESVEHRNENEAQQKANELEFRRQELAVREREIALAEKRLESEAAQKAEENDIRTYELQLTEKQHDDVIKSQKKDRVHDYIVTGLNTVVGVAKFVGFVGLTLIMADQGYKFEESGTSTSRTFKDSMKNTFDMVRDTFKK